MVKKREINVRLPDKNRLKRKNKKNGVIKVHLMLCPPETESLNPLSHEKYDWILDISSPRG